MVLVETSYEMGLCKISFFVVVGVIIGLVVLAAHTCCAQNSAKDYLDAHNAARAEVGVGPMTWDNTVAAYAQNYANQSKGDCNLVHSGGPYGENLAEGSGLFTATDAVHLWVEEKSNYDYSSNTCATGEVCRHYTQVVWRNSIHLGCARVQCNDGWFFVICNYDPPGNYVGQRPWGQNSAKDFLDAHNAARAEVGVGPMTWDNTVAVYAQNYANQSKGDCNLVHSGGPYGENLAAGTGSFTATYAVNLWVGEKSNYDYSSNTCAHGRVCGHYTQVVWRDSTHLGCARVQCNNGWWFVVCNYYPPGNYVGQRPGGQNSSKDFLDAHNAARAEVGVGPMTWDSTMAVYAQNYANQRKGDCNLVHSGGPYGENLAVGTGSFTATDAVNLWVGEKSNYDYSSNTCAHGSVCGHYTQVVWRNSTHLGCARVQCNNGLFFVICNYDPPGNYVGERPFCSPLISEYYTYEII